MQTRGDVRTPASLQATFAFISDPHKLAGCIPGCGALRELGENRYAAKLTNKIGFISVSFDVTVELTRIEPPTAIDATISGEAPAVGGRITAQALVRLEPDGTGTLIHYTVDINLSGKLGGIGQSVFRSKSDELGKKFGATLAAAIEADAAKGGAPA